MAVALESTIMQEIGLGQNYNWFNGSGSCEYIRRDALNKIATTIQKHHNEGEEIIAPDSQLIALARQASSWDEDQYTLTKAWQIASYIIAAHIHAYHDPQILTQTAQYIRKTYQPISRYSRYQDDGHWQKEVYDYPLN